MFITNICTIWKRYPRGKRRECMSIRELCTVARDNVLCNCHPHFLNVDLLREFDTVKSGNGHKDRLTMALK
jgi:hypothetical protein